MRTLTAREAGRYTARLDRIANILETKFDDLGLTKDQALSFAFEVDQISDEIERTALDAHNKKAELLSGDPADPELFMDDHFEGRRHEGDDDEPYMSLFEDSADRPSAQSGSPVSKRQEPDVQSLSEYADGFQKQPSQPDVGGSPFPEKAASSTPKTAGRRYRRQTGRSRSR